MSLMQSCAGCRSRKMKCDLGLPSCGACIQTGVECCTTDAGLGETVPRGYIHSLEQQVEQLERIQERRHSQPLHPQPEINDYIGPGTSADLFDELCCVLEISTLNVKDSSHSQHPLTLPDIGHILTPSLQHHLIAYYIATVNLGLGQILSAQQQEAWLQHPTPLLLCSPNPTLRAMMLSVFAVSARLLSRECAEYAYLANTCWKEVQRAVVSDVSVTDAHALDHVRTLCLMLVYELIDTSGGRFPLKLLNAAQFLLAAVPYIATDRVASVSQLGLFLSQIEVRVCRHFQRPSMQYQALRSLSNHPTTYLDTYMKLSQLTRTNIVTAELDSIFPQWQGNAQGQFDYETASICLSLHTLFTANLAWLSEPVACPCPELLSSVAHAARSYIEHLAGSSPLCIWMALEQALQAGFVWIVFVIYQLRTGGGRNDLFKPLMQCERVLSVLVERWKPGWPYYVSWDAVCQKILLL